MRLFRRAFGLVLIPLLGSRLTLSAIAQALDPSCTPPAATDESSPPTEVNESRPGSSTGSLVAAPLPISSPAVGSGIIPVVAYLFPLRKSDTKSPTSVIGAAGLFTDNGSRAVALAGEFYFGQDTYKATTAYVRGNLNYDVYGPGILFEGNTKLPLKQTGQVFFAEFLRRAWWDFFIGARFLDGSSVLTLRTGELAGIQLPPDLGLHSSLRGLGFRLQRDTRPNRFYPNSGTFTDVTGDFFAQAIGSKYSFQSYRLTFSKYRSLTQNQVLAFGSYACATGGRPPFYGNCVYGAQNQLRGYTAGRYFDRYMMTSQVEYRLSLPLRFGFAGFGGVGGVIPGQEQFLIHKALFLPNVGVGVRFALSKQYHLNLRADIAEGLDGHVFSMGVGEAF